MKLIGIVDGDNTVRGFCPFIYECKDIELDPCYSEYKTCEYYKTLREMCDKFSEQKGLYIGVTYLYQS